MNSQNAVHPTTHLFVHHCLWDLVFPYYLGMSYLIWVKFVYGGHPLHLVSLFFPNIYYVLRFFYVVPIMPLMKNISFMMNFLYAVATWYWHVNYSISKDFFCLVRHEKLKTFPLMKSIPYPVSSASAFFFQIKKRMGKTWCIINN